MPDFIQDMIEPSRRVLLCELLNGPRTVTELVDATGLKQPNVSNHLAKLRDRDIVQAQKVGRQVFYSLQGHDIEVVVRNLMVRQDEPEPLDEGQVSLKLARFATAGDDEGAMKLLDAHMRTQRDIVKVYENTFGEAFYLIGKWYEVQAIDVAQEHLATAILERLMTRVMHYASVPPSTGPKAMLACVPENYHSVGLRMLNDCLRLRGWHTLYLGANVPLDSLLARIEEETPRLLLLSAAIPEHLGDLKRTLEAVINTRARLELTMQVGIGGQAVTLPEAQPIVARADFTAKSLTQFNELIPSLS